VKNGSNIRWAKEHIKKMGRPCSTNELVHHINVTTRHGTRVESLGNVLSKSKEFVKVGSEKIVGTRSSYMIALWDANEEKY